VEAHTGVSAQTIYDARTRGRVPRPQTLLQIARAYRVPLEYLADDQAPPKAPANSAAYASDDELMAEVKRRYEREAGQVRDLLNEAWRIDWSTVGGRLVSEDVDPSRDQVLSAALHVLRALQTTISTTLDHFDIGYFGDRYGATRSHRDPEPSSLNQADLLERYHRLVDAFALERTAASVFHRWMMSVGRNVFVSDPDAAIEQAREALEHYRQVGGPYRET